MYIYKKKINNKIYYYLRISKRENNKLIVKDIANLGTDPDKIRDKIKLLEKEYSKEIRKSIRTINRTIDYEHFKKKIKEQKLKSVTGIEYDDLIKLEALKLHFNKKIKQLDKKTFEEYIENYVSEYAWNTASMEGNTIPLKEAQNYFIQNRTPKNSTIEEVYDLRNNKEAIKYLFYNIEDLNIDEITIKFIHSIIVKDVDTRTGYRTFDVRVLNSQFDATPFQYINEDIKELIKWYNKNKTELHPLILASIFHHRFEQIHPFADGNGRTGRILLNYILLINNYPPIMIRKKSRNLYRQALNKADKSNFININLKYYEELFSYLIFELENTYTQNFL